MGHHADARLISGPGNTTKALHITKAQNHSELLTEDAQFQIVEGVSLNETDIVATPRIGISQGVDKLWRFIIHPQTVETILKNSSF